MIQHISAWIGEERLDGPEYEGIDADPYKIQMRAVKRACVCALMEQMVNIIANDNDCFCNDQRVDCKCFAVENNNVPCRISKLHLMAARLYYGSTTSNWADKKQAMRMMQTRTYWMNTHDVVICRNAALLKLRTKDWGRRADDALSNLCNLLNFDVVPVEATPAQYDFFNESDDESAIAAPFGDLQVQRNRNQTQTHVRGMYDVTENSIDNEIQKFLNQPNCHFVECKSYKRKIDK